MLVANDSAWCWFADPRAVWYHSWIVAGGVTSSGDVVANLLNPRTEERYTCVLAEAFERDDHDNPAFLKLSNGRLAAFYTKHTGHEIFVRETLEPGNPSLWGPARRICPNDPAFQGPEGSRDFYTYPNPQRLEDGRIFLFYRGMNWKPTFTVSDDDGETWSTGKIVVRGSERDPNNRPYMKVWGDGKHIHLAFTDGHPHNERTNSIYYVRYEDERFQTAKGNPLDLPIGVQQADCVYDGTEGRAWIWDVGADASGLPIIVYARIPDPEHHEYRYARWDGTKWIDHRVTGAGRWFPQTPEGEQEREPYYSGGIALDHNGTSSVVLSRPIEGRFEIERWTTGDGGATWSSAPITRNSSHDNIRPVVLPRDGTVWMQAQHYAHYTDYQTCLVTKR